MRKLLLPVLSLFLGFSLLSSPMVQAAFPDVPENHPNRVAIEAIQDLGIVSGADDGNFYPDRFVNRAELLKMATLCAKLILQKDVELNFPDVSESDWFYEFVQTAVALGIVGGYPDGTFRPAQTVNKAEALKMLLKAKGIDTQRPSADLFTDVKVSDWFSEYVNYSVSNELIDISGESFNPSEGMTRAQLAEIIYRMLILKGEISPPSESPEASAPSSSTREIMITDGVKHSVPLEDILGGGPPKDGIPSIDNPKFVSVAEANEFLNDEGLGVAVSFNGIDRFYANQITVWHEIVNDNVGGQPALVTYCPLCGTGIVFAPIIQDEAVEFGTSGKLWNSNLVMYDRKTDTYWSQVLGEAIKGELTGTRLKLLAHDNLRWKDWKVSHPDGEVLSTETGYFRDYTHSPYQDYDINDDIYFPVDNTDDRYHEKEPTWGIVIDNQAKVYPQSELDKSSGDFSDQFAGISLQITYDQAEQTIDIRRTDTGEEIVPFYGFWFSWISVWPDSEVYVAP